MSKPPVEVSSEAQEPSSGKREKNAANRPNAGTGRFKKRDHQAEKSHSPDSKRPQRTETSKHEYDERSPYKGEEEWLIRK